MKESYMHLKGGEYLRQCLLLSTLSTTPVLINDIRPDDMSPGFRSHEILFLRLLEMISDGCVIEINETGTKLKYKLGVLMGGRNLVPA
ncbi:hypothetical protein GIB67_024484 [Kingdonia uniflora]|uniref:RNA 3'-terminal phosphate cyclase domain-containing protein n=1 Tax=Kingdonia uniflora TaxID=39325 RepID=A0A7J7LNP7_9MAGN|nr:hypothetical protein GIB67_024484 [Kingdonia uniflora]